MESERNYEDSRNELIRIYKTLGTDSVVINMKKLDGMTKQVMIQAITNVISTRKREIEGVILGAK